MIQKNDPRCEHCLTREKGLLGALCTAEATKLSDQKNNLDYKKGQRIFQEGEFAHGVYCINSGKIKISKIGHDGKEQILRISSEGDLLGHRTIFANKKFSVSAETLEDCSICFIPKSEFLRSVLNNPQLNADILKSICIELQIEQESIVAFAQKSVRERTAAALFLLYSTYQTTEAEQVAIKFSRADLANMVGTANETLIRQLKDFKEEGLLNTSGSLITIIKPEILKSIGLID